MSEGDSLVSDELIDAEELARGYSVVQLAETAEEYFASVTDWTYHLSKPLGSIAEAPTILSHFGAMLSALRLEVGLDVLDFGAGSCWTSRMLTQLGCHVVACDVSSTALAMGRRLFELQPPLGPGTVRFLRFDGTTIDMPDGSVDRISCMDAFHHVPNWEEVLAEFQRLLRPGGRAVLAESGPDHSRTAQAQSEMRNFTVVERDVVVEDLAKPRLPPVPRTRQSGSMGVCHFWFLPNASPRNSHRAKSLTPLCSRSSITTGSWS